MKQYKQRVGCRAYCGVFFIHDYRLMCSAVLQNVLYTSERANITAEISIFAPIDLRKPDNVAVELFSIRQSGQQTNQFTISFVWFYRPSEN